MPKCKCGKEIIWGLTEAGKPLPLDAKALVFIPTGEVRQTKYGPTMVYKIDKDAKVSHFATCPNANEFSGKGKAKQEDLPI